MLHRVTVTTIAMLAMAAFGIGPGLIAPDQAKAEEEVPTYYFWTDLYQDCPAECNAQYFKCPCVGSEPDPPPPYQA